MYLETSFVDVRSIRAYTGYSIGGINYTCQGCVTQIQKINTHRARRYSLVSLLCKACVYITCNYVRVFPSIPRRVRDPLTFRNAAIMRTLIADRLEGKESDGL